MRLRLLPRKDGLPKVRSSSFNERLRASKRYHRWGCRWERGLLLLVACRLLPPAFSSFVTLLLLRLSTSRA